ncbi:unnamed protein product [Peniophora sp. CBMAI 1063]|nr:unnamed protein product [Peniophora sp. CBMAI 1063]
MTILFKRIRIAYFSTICILSAVVLAASAYFANIYLPDNKAHAGFSVYALVISALTIISGFIQLFSRAQPRTETPFLFIVGVFWLSVAAWALDQSVDQECYGLGNTQTSTKHGDVSSRAICYATKIVEAFSWTVFVMFAIAFIIVINRTATAKVLGHPDIWAEPMDNLPWYDELPGYPGESWFGSDFHRYHHRYGYEQGAPLTGAGRTAASRAGYGQLSPTITEPMMERQPSPPEDHYTRAREKSSRRSRRAASPRTNPYENGTSRTHGRSRSIRQPTVDVDYGQQLASGVPMATSQYAEGYGHDQALPGMPIATTTQPGVGATVNVGGAQVQQLPGHSMIIRGGSKGAPPQIEQVPGYYNGP